MEIKTLATPQEPIAKWKSYEYSEYGDIEIGRAVYREFANPKIKMVTILSPSMDYQVIITREMIENYEWETAQSRISYIVFNLKFMTECWLQIQAKINQMKTENGIISE